MSPTFKELVISSGLLEATTKITLINNSSIKLFASVRANDFSALNDSGGITYGKHNSRAQYGLAKWVNFPGGSNFELLPGKTVNVPVQITNQADMAPGGHYGAIIVTAVPATSHGNNKVTFKQELVSLLFVKKHGGEKYGLQLESMRTNSGDSEPEKVLARFKGTGNVHVVPRGFVQVTDPRGQVVAKGTLNPESTMVLPGQSRQFATLLQPVNPSDLPGRYKITAYYRHDDQNGFDIKSIYFNRVLISPWLIAVVALTVVSGGIIGRKVFSRQRKSFRR